MFAKFCARLTLAFLLLLVVAACLAGCATRRGVTVEKPRTGQIVEPPPPADNPQAAKAGEQDNPVSFAPPGCVAIFFDFDRSDIRGDQRWPLNANIKFLLETPGNVMIDGNCDERGTVEWNMALGQRRADAIALAFREAGVSPGRLATVSHGKERAEGHGEIGWAKDRRADITLQE